MIYTKREIIEKINKVIDEVKKVLSRYSSTTSFNINPYNNLIESLEKISEVINSDKIKEQYLHHFYTDIDTIYHQYIMRNNNYNELNENDLINKLNDLTHYIDSAGGALKEKYIFFDKIGFFDRTIVIVGKNGSGKTLFSSYIKKILITSTRGVYISAQKILFFPQYNTLSNVEISNIEFERLLNSDRSSRVTFLAGDLATSNTYLQQIGFELKTLMDKLISHHLDYRYKITQSIIENNYKEIPENFINRTKLEEVVCLWNDIVKDRKLSIVDGIKLNVYNEETQTYYDIQDLSDGEKIIFYYITYVLLAPNNGFIIIDEPEQFLHKSIVFNIWDKLEKEREDCIFIYCTHDLDFASSRKAKLLWLKKYIKNENWILEEIPRADDIPQPLLLEILGSRKNIIFCEGSYESFDYRLYSILFPDKIIKPVAGCLNVINYTKAINRQSNLNIRAFGIIDKDFVSEERIEKLNRDNIKVLRYAEVENIFLIKEFLEDYCSQTERQFDFDLLKNKLIKKLNTCIEDQSLNYLKSYIDNRFKQTNIKKHNTFESFSNSWKKEVFPENIDDIYKERKKMLKDLVDREDYDSLIKVYNDKGMIKIVKDVLKNRNFIEEAMRLITTNHKLQKLIREKITNQPFD